MKLIQNLLKGNIFVAESKSLSSSCPQDQLGNFTPRWMYDVFQLEGIPDFLGIYILSDALSRYRKSKNFIYRRSYEHWIKKLNVTIEQIYDACTRLDKIGVITHLHKTKYKVGSNFSCELYFMLDEKNINNLLSLIARSRCNSTPEKVWPHISSVLELTHREDVYRQKFDGMKAAVDRVKKQIFISGGDDYLSLIKSITPKKFKIKKVISAHDEVYP